MSEDFIVIIRPTFKKFCGDACRAAALNHLLFRIAYKCKDQPKEKIQAGEVLWYATTEQLTSEMSDAWGTCKVRKEVNELITMGLVGRTKDPVWGVNRTKHFYFGKEQCATFLHLCEEQNICVVHLDLPPEVMHLIYSSNANDKSIKCSCQEPGANDESIGCIRYIYPMQMIDSSPANDKSIEAITKKDYKDNNKEDSKEGVRGDEVAIATAAPPFDEDEIEPPLKHTRRQRNDRGVVGDRLPADSHHPTSGSNLPRTEADPQRSAHRTRPGVRASPGDAAPRTEQASREGTKRQQQAVGTSKGEVTPPADLLASVTPEVAAIVQEWLAIFNDPRPVTLTMIKHATALAAYKPRPGEIVQCRLWMYQTDEKKWYTTHGMHLGDIAREFEKWRSLASVPRRGSSPPTDTASIDPEAEKQRIAASHAAAQAKMAALIAKQEAAQAARKGHSNGNAGPGSRHDESLLVAGGAPGRRAVVL